MLYRKLRQNLTIIIFGSLVVVFHSTTHTHRQTRTKKKRGGEAAQKLYTLMLRCCGLFTSKFVSFCFILMETENLPFLIDYIEVYKIFPTGSLKSLEST